MSPAHEDHKKNPHEYHKNNPHRDQNDRSVPGLRYRHQKRGQELPTEWTEFIGFSHFFNKDLVQLGNTITTSLHWEELMKESKASITTVSGAKVLQDELPLLQDKTITTFTTTEGQKLAVYIPQGLSSPWKGKPDPRIVALNAIQKYVTTAPPSVPGRDKKRYPHHSDRRQEKEQRRLWKAFTDAKVAKYGAYGVYHLGFWHAQGHTHVDANIASDMVRSATRHTATLTFYQEMGPIFQTIGRLFQEIDPCTYALYRRNYERACSTSSVFNNFRVSNRGCFHCLALLVNTQVGPHKDGNDVKDGWVAMACFGDFEGGELCLPGIGCKIPFQPGDVVLFRSAVLEHWVAPFQGTRYSCVFFTKQSTWAPFDDDDFHDAEDSHGDSQDTTQRRKNNDYFEPKILDHPRRRKLSKRA